MFGKPSLTRLSPLLKRGPVCGQDQARQGDQDHGRGRPSWPSCCLSSFAGAAEWPQFGGPNSSGIGDGKPPVEFGPSQNVLWKTAVGSGLSSPIIAKGRVFLTEFDRATKQLATLCIDQRMGNPSRTRIWISPVTRRSLPTR